MKRLVRWFQGGRGRYVMWIDKDNKVRRARPVFRVRPFFAWYDLWRGIYIDREKRQVYWCPIWCVCFQIGYQRPANEELTGSKQPEKGTT